MLLLDSGSEQLQRIRYIGEDSGFLVISSSCCNLVQDTPTPRVKVRTLPSARVFSNLCSKETRLSVQLQPQQRTCINQIGYRKQLDTNNSSQCCRHRMQAGCRDVKELHLTRVSYSVAIITVSCSDSSSSNSTCHTVRSRQDRHQL